ncbi:MAG: hypothetical protein AB7N61_23240 [Acidimicrobiia bacterium]
MASIQHIDGERSAGALADLLNGNARRRPVVVVTIPAGRTEPWIDVEEVAREAGNLADVYLMPTGDFTWEFSRRMADGTQVYGGAGRVYPVGHEWSSDLSKSPLRFAFDAKEGERATQQLISDTLRMAAAAGLLQQIPTRELRQVSGPVKMVVAGRALVDVGNMLPAAIAEELTVEDVPIERMVTAGQRITGWYDAETNRVDVTKSLRASGEALAAYAVGDVIFTKVAMVKGGKAELVLYPKTSTAAVTATVLRADVTTNPADDLRTLMTVGEVIPARVVTTAPKWSLILNDVDDDEPIVEAPSLLVGARRGSLRRRRFSSMTSRRPSSLLRRRSRWPRLSPSPRSSRNPPLRHQPWSPRRRFRALRCSTGTGDAPFRQRLDVRHHRPHRPHPPSPRRHCC